MGNQDRTKNLSILVENDKKIVPYSMKSPVNPAMEIAENVAAFLDLNVNNETNVSKRRRSSESLAKVSKKSLKKNDGGRYNCLTNHAPPVACPLTTQKPESHVPNSPCTPPKLNNPEIIVNRPQTSQNIQKISYARLFSMRESYPRKRKSKRSICRMCQRILTQSMNNQSSLCCLECPFVCYLKFASRESLRRHIMSAHLICGCKYQRPSDSSIDFNWPLTHNCPLCDQEFPQCNSLESHLFSGHDFNFFDTYPVKNDEPRYMIIPEDLFSAKKYSWSSHARSGISGPFICDICAIKFPSIRELLHHFNTTDHKMNIQELGEFRGNRRESDTGESTLDLSQSPLEILHQQNQLKTYKRPPRKLPQKAPKLVVTNSKTEDCNVAMDDYLTNINDQEATVNPSTPDDSMDEYEGYEYLEPEEPEEPPQTTPPSPNDSLESPDNPKDPHSFPLILESLLTPDTTATDSTASEESKLPSISSQTPHKSPKIIEDSRTFDEKTLLYLEKLQKDHKSLNNARSMLLSKLNPSDSPLKSKPNLKKISLTSPPPLQPLPPKTTPEPTPPAQHPHKQLFPRSCPKCKKHFTSTLALAKHLNLIQQLESPSNTPQKCPKCLKNFKNQHVLETHKYLIHHDTSGIHFCNNCCTILTTTSMVNNHQCTTASSFSCKPCKKTFSNSQKLLYHNLTNHLETSGPHTCRVCQKSFLTKSMMTHHTLEAICTNPSKMAAATETNNNDKDGGQDVTETSSKLHICNTCQLSCPTQEDLLQHNETVHNQETCKLCLTSCQKESIPNHILKNHILMNDVDTLSGESTPKGDIRVYDEDIMNSICQYSRYQKSLKTPHLVCLKCNMMCQDVDSFKRHYARKHDTCCILCYKKFDRVSEALYHKIQQHKSVEIYIWVIANILCAFCNYESIRKQLRMPNKSQKTLIDKEKKQADVINNTKDNVPMANDKGPERGVEITGDSTTRNSLMYGFWILLQTQTFNLVV